jgi:hypothetical protein
MYLESNLTYLSEYNAPLIEELKTMNQEDVEILHVGDEFIFKLQDLHGKEFYTGSIYDPVYEADVFLKDVNFDNTGYLVLGLSSSAIIKKILERKTETAWVFVVERDIRIIKKFLEEVDLSVYFEGKPNRLVFFYGDESQTKRFLSGFIHSLVGFYFLQAEVLKTFVAYRLYADYYQHILEYFRDTLKNHVFNIGNNLEDTRMGIKNEIRNLKHVFHRPRFRDLKDKYKGKPIICVATGPSLDKQLPLLKEVKGKALIICAESALRVLLRNGIVPDIVCILERIENSFNLSVKGVDIPEETVLVGLTVIDPRIFDYWPKYFVPVFKENLVNSRFINRSLGDFGEIYCGNSVAHMCYMLANHLGGDPIILIGQDLAYSEEGATHSKDSFYNEEAAQDIDENIRKQIQHSLSNEGLHNKVVYLDGYYGGKVRSRLLWQQFLIWFEHHVEMSSALTINATEGGVHIKGTERRPFKEVIKQYCTDFILPVPNILKDLETEQARSQELLENLTESFDKLKEKMKSIRDYAEENINFLKKLMEELDKGIETSFLLEMKLSRILAHNEQLVKEILVNEYISFYLRPLVAYMHIKINPISRIHSIERAKEVLKIQLWFLENVKEGIDKFIELQEKEMENLMNSIL